MPDDIRRDTSPLHAVPDTPTPAAGRWSPNALKWSAARAARETGAARSTILEALKSGRLEGSKDADGHWQITPQALAVAGFTPGKPTPPDQVPVLEDHADADELNRLRAELDNARADARVFAVERDAERRLRESDARVLEAVTNERDLYRRMLEQGKSSHTPPESPQAAEQAAPMPSHGPDPSGASTGEQSVWEFVKMKRDQRRARRRR